MTRLQKVDPKVLRHEYVYAEPTISITELADKYGLARSGVADKARIGGWYEAREEFRAKVSEGTRDALAEKWVAFQTANYERLMEMAATYLDKYQAALKKDEIKVSTRDMLGIAAMMRTFLADMSRAPADADPRLVNPDGEEFTGTEAEARSVIEQVKALMAGGTGDGTDAAN